MLRNALVALLALLATLPRVWSLTVIGLLATASNVSAQGGPTGPEFRVNTYTTGSQRFRSAAGSFNSGFVVTWESANQDGDQYGIYAQRYANPNGSPLGGEFRVNSYTTSDQLDPRVATDTGAQFIVVWQSDNQDGDDRGIYAQRYQAGVPLGGEFRVNTNTTSGQTLPDVAMFPGGFVVVWGSAGQDGSGDGIFGQRYAGTGVPLGAEFRVNTYTTGAQRFASVASDIAGNFVVTWEGYSSNDQLLGIFGQRYSSAGAPLGGEFRVNSYTTGNQRSPALDRDLSGAFTIVWQSDGQDGSGEGVFGQRYDTGGAPLGDEFRVNAFTTLNQSAPDVNRSGGFRDIVTWQGDLQDGSASGIFARFYLGGVPIGQEYRMNTFTAGPQTDPGVAFAQYPQWLFVWTSAQDPGGSLGVYAQGWSDIPVELQTFTVE